MANKVIRLTESDLERIIRRVIAEQEMEEGFPDRLKQVSETVLKMMDEKS